MSRVSSSFPSQGPQDIGSAREASRSRSSNAVSQGDIPRRRFGYPLRGAALRPTQVSQGLAPPADAPPAARHSGALLQALLKPRMDTSQIVESLYEAGSESGLVEDLSKHYQADFAVAQDQFLDQMDNETLVRLHNRLNSREILRLRATGRYAANGTLKGLSTDPEKNQFFSDQVMHMGIRLNLLEIGIRERLDKAGYTFVEKKIPLYTKEEQIPSSVRRMLSAFFREQDKKVSVGRGDMKERIGPEWCETTSTGYEHTRPAPVDPYQTTHPGETLAVSETFLVDFYRTRFVFQGAQGEKTAQELVPAQGRHITDPDLRQEISDMMLNYCGGDRTQAVRLSMALSQSAAAAPMALFAGASQKGDGLISVPLPKGQDFVFITDDSLNRRMLSVQKKENGDIQVRWRQHLPFSAVVGMGTGSSMYRVDKKASALVYDLEGVIPKTTSEGEEKPSVLESATYKYVLSVESPEPVAFAGDGYNQRPY